jgi:hypothetical protein
LNVLKAVLVSTTASVAVPTVIAHGRLDNRDLAIVTEAGSKYLEIARHRLDGHDSANVRPVDARLVTDVGSDVEA